MDKKKWLDFDYITSKDYEKLFQLVQKQRVICIVTYTNNIKDICASSILTTEDRISISCRGTGYIEAFPYDGKTTKEDFLKQCEDYKLEFIDPDMIKNKVQ